MAHFESRLDKQIREAAERGEFENLPGAGKPLPGAGRPLDDDWWLKNWMVRENITGVLPTTLALRKETEELDAILAKKFTEPDVREYLDDFNQRIRAAQRGPVDGPPVVLHTVDTDEAVKRWKQNRRA